DFDYGRDTLAAFRTDVVADLKPQDIARHDSRLASDPIVYTRTFPERWRAFRAGRMTDLMSRLRTAVKDTRPTALVSAAVVPNPEAAATHRLQDWRAWLARDLVDVVCPMAYTTDEATFASQVSAATEAAGDHPVW